MFTRLNRDSIFTIQKFKGFKGIKFREFREFIVSLIISVRTNLREIERSSGNSQNSIPAKINFLTLLCLILGGGKNLESSFNYYKRIT